MLTGKYAEFPAIIEKFRVKNEVSLAELLMSNMKLLIRR